MYGEQCPLEPHVSAKGILQMRLDQVKLIEDHVSSGSCQHPPLREFICHGEIAGTTPLILACRDGQLDSVKHILEVWGVDVQASAVYYYRSIKIDAATPLFVAASNGHVDIVRYLLEKGASFATKTVCASHTQNDGLTPLVGAFCRPTIDDKKEPPHILRLLLEAGADPNTLLNDGMKFTRDTEVATLLINHGLDLTVRHPTFSFAILHYWVINLADFAKEEQYLSVVKLLIDKGADPLVRDYCGFSPILSAAAFQKLSILDHILKRDGIPRTDQIDALELAGAVILGDSYYALLLGPKAFDYWRRALQLRQLETEEGGPLNKTPLKYEHVKTVEWVTADELEDVIQDPSKHLVHSFLLKLRIAKSCELAVNRFLYPLSGEHPLLQQPDKFAYKLDILWASMETIRQDSSGELSDRAQSTTETLVQMLSSMERDHPLLLTVETMKISLQLISDTDDKASSNVATSNSTLNYMLTLLQLFELIARLPQMLNSDTPGEQKGGTMKENLKRLVLRKRRDDYRQTLLIIACGQVYSLPNEVRLETIRLLLDSGADPNEVYGFGGNAPLHSLAKFNGEVADAVANLLLEKGAHFDRVNKSGMTAADVWMECNEGANGWKDRPSWLRRSVPPLLMCQCARVIRFNKVPYKSCPPGTLPASLYPFIELH